MYKGFETRRTICVDLCDFKLYVDPDDLLIGSHIATSKSYEPHVTTAVQQYLKARQTFLDIGANVGFFSFLAASIVGPTGRVISIEPNPRNIKHPHASRELSNFDRASAFVRPPRQTNRKLYSSILCIPAE